MSVALLRIMLVDKEEIKRRVGSIRYERGKQLAWERAPGTGRGLDVKAVLAPEGDELYDIIIDVLELAFSENDSATERLQKVCELYFDFPSYSIFSQYFTSSGAASTMSPETVRSLTGFLARCLDAPEPEFADPAAYVLWVDLFEDSETVDVSWERACKTISTEIGWRRLLECAGPVPVRLKEPIWEHLHRRPELHQAIFASLFHSVFDVCGSIDRRTVERWLPRLSINAKDERMTLLAARLADPTSLPS